MDPAPFLDRAFDDEGLTRDLDEPEATELLKCVADRIRRLASSSVDVSGLRTQVEELCRGARDISARVAASTTPAATLQTLIREL